MNKLFTVDPASNKWNKPRPILLGLVSVLLALSSLHCSLVTSMLAPGDHVDGEIQQDPQDQQDPLNQDPPLDPGQNAPPEYKLPGIWVSDTDTGYGTIMHTELILEYTGTFSQQVTAGSLMTWDVGVYEVGDGFIRFVVENHEPKEYMGRTMSWLTGFTYFYTFVDQNTILLEDHISGNSWYAFRE